jgi:hypothetical protein
VYNDGWIYYIKRSVLYDFFFGFYYQCVDRANFFTELAEEGKSIWQLVSIDDLLVKILMLAKLRYLCKCSLCGCISCNQFYESLLL